MQLPIIDCILNEIFWNLNKYRNTVYVRVGEFKKKNTKWEIHNVLNTTKILKNCMNSTPVTNLPTYDIFKK